MVYHRYRCLSHTIAVILKKLIFRKMYNRFVAVVFRIIVFLLAFYDNMLLTAKTVAWKFQNVLASNLAWRMPLATYGLDGCLLIVPCRHFTVGFDLLLASESFFNCRAFDFFFEVIGFADDVWLFVDSFCFVEFSLNFFFGFSDFNNSLDFKDALFLDAALFVRVVAGNCLSDCCDADDRGRAGGTDSNSDLASISAAKTSCSAKNK